MNKYECIKGLVFDDREIPPVKLGMFGMGTGGTFSPLSPETVWIRFVPSKPHTGMPRLALRSSFNRIRLTFAF